MYPKTLVTSLLYMVAATLYATPQSDIQYLTELKTTIWPGIYKNSDVAALASLTHPEFIIIDANGDFTSKSEELTFLESYKWPHDEFRYEIESLKLFENGTAIVAGKGTARGENDQGEYCFVYTSSNVLIKTDERWQAIQSHVSGFNLGCE